MDTYIVYFDETGDDGANTCSSNQFVLTGMYMSADSWQDNYDKLRACRKELRKKYGLFSGGARRKANRLIDNAQQQMNAISSISVGKILYPLWMIMSLILPVQNI